LPDGLVAPCTGCSSSIISTAWLADVPVSQPRPSKWTRGDHCCAPKAAAVVLVRTSPLVLVAPIDCVSVIAPLAATVVNPPVEAVVAPIDVLLIVLAAVGLIVRAPAGLIVTVPVPVGLIAMLALAGDIVTAPEKVAAAAVIVPVSVGEAENTTLVLPVVPLTVVPWILATVVAVAVPPAEVTSPDKVLAQAIAVPLAAVQRSPVVRPVKLALAATHDVTPLPLVCKT